MKLKGVSVFIVVLFLLGCKAKHKTIARETVKEEIKKEALVNTVSQNDIVLNSDVSISSSDVKLENIKEIDLSQADSSKTIIVDFNGKTLKIKGANAKIKTTETKQSVKDTMVDKSVKIDRSTAAVSNNIKETSKKDNVTRKAESNVKGVNVWWIWGIVILLVIGFVIYRYFKGYFW